MKKILSAILLLFAVSAKAAVFPPGPYGSNSGGGSGGGGTVTAVTASAPLSSSGGTTPNISLTGTVSSYCTLDSSATFTNATSVSVPLSSTTYTHWKGTMAAFAATTSTIGLTFSISNDAATGSYLWAIFNGSSIAGTSAQLPPLTYPADPSLGSAANNYMFYNIDISYGNGQGPAGQAYITVDGGYRESGAGNMYPITATYLDIIEGPSSIQLQATHGMTGILSFCGAN